MYTYNRSASTKPKVEKAIKAVKAAIEALHECAPNGKDFPAEDEGKAYGKAVMAHGKRVEALREILFDLNAQ